MRIDRYRVIYNMAILSMKSRGIITMDVPPIVRSTQHGTSAEQSAITSRVVLAGIYQLGKRSSP